MDAAAAIDELKGLSTQIEVILVGGRDGAVQAATVEGARPSGSGGLARDLVAGADSVRGDLGRDALSQLQAATPDGSVFVVLDGDRMAVATTGADPTVGLVFYDLKTLLRQLAAGDDDGAAGRRRPGAAEAPTEEAAMPKRRIWLGALLGAGSFVGTIFYRRRSVRTRTRVDLYFDDGSMLSLAAGSPDADRLLPHRPRPAGGGWVSALRAGPSSAAGWWSGRTSRATSCCAPGRRSRYYLDKYRFETDPAAAGGARARAGRARAPRTRRRPSSWPDPSSAPCRWRR